MKVFAILPAPIIDMVVVEMGKKRSIFVVCSNGRTYKVDEKGRYKRVKM